MSFSKQIFTFFLFLVAFIFRIHAEETSMPLLPFAEEEATLRSDVVQLFQDAPLLKQNLRKFETLSMQITEEKFEDGKWKLKWTQRMKADLKKDALKFRKVCEEKKYRTYEDYVFFPDRIVWLHANIDDSEFEPFSPSKLLRAEASVSQNVGRSSALAVGTLLPSINHSGADFIWFYYPADHKARSLLDIILDPTYQDKRWMKIKTLGNNCVLVQIDTTFQCYIDLTKGMPVKYVGIMEQENGAIRENYTMEVTEFTSKDGWLFPTGILCKINGKPYSRQKIDPNTLEINKPLTPKDFTVKFFPGTRIVDSINNKEYIAGQHMTSADINELETQLKALVEKVKADTNKGK